ncbi:MAG: hypothetical protein ACI82H_001196 [Alphaproteobacteria bacterium]
MREVKEEIREQFGSLRIRWCSKVAFKLAANMHLFWHFIKTPDGISLELLQKNKALPAQEPWASISNTGSW